MLYFVKMFFQGGHIVLKILQYIIFPDGFKAAVKHRCDLLFDLRKTVVRADKLKPAKYCI